MRICALGVTLGVALGVALGIALGIALGASLGVALQGAKRLLLATTLKCNDRLSYKAELLTLVA